MKFDWDTDKEKANVKNHDGIYFSEAAKVFLDEWAIDEFDAQHSTVTEKRYTIIGLAENTLLRVTFAVTIDEIGDEVFRIISARRAKGKDKIGYEQSRNKYEFRDDRY